MKRTKSIITALAVLFTSTFSRAQSVQTFTFQGNVFQQFIVPSTGWYFIDASGGQGGPASNGSHQGGLGARMQGYVQLQAGDTLRIGVGGTGGTGSNAGNNVSGGGGGGSSSIIKLNGTAYSPLLIAGGGGGGAANYNGSSGLASPSGSPSWGGTNGSGGGLGTNSNYYGGAGGGGYNTNGQSHYGRNGSTLLSQGGFAYLNGNAGGNSGNNGGDGGWGGGGQGGPATTGVTNNNDGGGGGGGGWSGGGGGSNQGDGGGGGGSYVDATLNTSNCLAVDGANSGNGTVSIEYLSYSNASVDTSFTFQGNVFQYFTAPATGYYQITALGASGGSVNGNSGGKGAQVQGYFLLRAGETVKIATGGAGQDGIYGSAGYPTLWTGAGGGGSSSVIRFEGTSVMPLMIAGGGGGAANGNFGAGRDASTNANGVSGGGYDATAGAIATGGLGGSGGSGGKIGINSGSGGAGFNSDGASSTVATGGQSYLNGNFGGAGTSGASGGWGGGGQGALYDYDTDGIDTFRTHGSGSGGGGYSGGGGGGWVNFYGVALEIDRIYGGGGGGSFSAAQCGGANISGANTGNGSVSISGPNVSIDTVNTPGPTYTWAANGVTYQHSGTYYHIDQANCIVQVLDLSIGGLGGCLNYTRIDTTITSCGSYTSPLNGRTYTENTTDSFRLGCNFYVVHLIVTLPKRVLGNMIIGQTSAAASEPLQVCKRSTQTFFVKPVPYATAYQWTLPSGATGISTTNSINVQFSSRFSGGNICVTPVNACGTGEPICRAVTVLNTPPTGRLQIAGPAEPFISGNYSVSPIAGATTYTWSVSNNEAVIVSGQGTPNIQLTAQPGFTRASLSVVASNCRGTGSRGTLVLANNRNAPGTIFVRKSILDTERISIYPNPSNGLFTISLPSFEMEATLEVYSTDGRLVYQKNIPSNTTQMLIDLQQPAAGLYQVRVVVGEEVRSVKVVVN